MGGGGGELSSVFKTGFRAVKDLVSADLGGRVGWLPKAERVKTLFFSPLQAPKRGGWGGGGGGRGGYPGFVSLQVPTVPLFAPAFQPLGRAPSP